MDGRTEGRKAVGGKIKGRREILVNCELEKIGEYER